MSFLLQLHEVDKARAIGRKALDKIALREEAEKLNVWMALVNLEIGFGTTESREKVWKEAAEYNDKRTVWARYADALVAAGKQAVSCSPGSRVKLTAGRRGSVAEVCQEVFTGR